MKSDQLIGRALCFQNNPNIRMTQGDTLHNWSFLPTERFAVIHYFGCGRELIATKDFHAGELILRETPLIVFEDHKDLVQLIGQLTASERDELFDMQGLSSLQGASQDVCRKVMDKLWTESEVFHRLFYSDINKFSVSIEDIFRVLSIAHLNAHSFHPSEQEPDRAAIFPVSAKIAHSCLPNSTYSVTDDGLEYYAITSIKSGTCITASYLDNDSLISSADKRRVRLARSKDFFCLCIKCRRPDMSTALPCRSSGCAGVSCCTNTGNFTSQKHWRCNICDIRTVPVIKILQSVDREYNALQDCDNVDDFIDQLTCLIDASKPDLSRTHSLLIDMKVELSTVHLAVAHALNEQNNGQETMVNAHRRTAIEILGEVVSHIECIDDMCTSLHTPCCQLSHPPTTTAVFLVYRALCSVVRIKSVTLPVWIRRYQPLLEILYGIENSNVATLNDYKTN